MRTPRIAAIAVAAVLALPLAACGSSGTSNSTGGYPACPVKPIKVVVSVDQWGDIVSALGGSCTKVTTVIKSSAVDPHDYDPTVADIARFNEAKLVVVNGVDYDPWALRATSNVSPKPALLDAGVVTGVKAGENPHLWYSPDYVSQVAAAVTTQLKKVLRDATGYFDTRAEEWQQDMSSYFATITAIKAAHTGAKYAATESVFDYMAAACGLVDVTPAGYRNAAANDSDPAPADVAALDRTLSSKEAAVLIYNTQTEGAIPQQARRSAESAGVPVVDVTETVAPGYDSFQAWQVAQLDALMTALGGPK